MKIMKVILKKNFLIWKLDYLCKDKVIPALDCCGYIVP